MVTIEWLVGSGISIVGIVVIIVTYQHNLTRKAIDCKVDRILCEERHERIDKMHDKVDRINDSVIRIESILNGIDKRGKQEIHES